MPTMRIAIGDLADELRELPKRDLAALRRAIHRTVAIDAQRWIQWSIRGGDSPRPPRSAPAPSGERERRSRLGGLLGRLGRRNNHRGSRPSVPGSRPPSPPGACERRAPPDYRVPIDTGDYAASWRFDFDSGTGEGVIYSSPNPPIKAGVIEYGRRPAPIPIEPLAQWVRRKFGCNDPGRARSIAHAISRYAAKHARPGLRVLERAHPKIAEALARNVERELRVSISEAAASRAIERD